MKHHQGRPPLPPIPAPSPFAERRRAFRRSEDQSVHEERALLARALDVLAGPGDAATQVAEILAMLARVVGARRAAILTERPSRRVLVSAGPGEEPAEARELAAWLDARAARAAAVRAATAAAEITVVRTRRASPDSAASAPAAGDPVDRFLRLDVPGAAVQLGLELTSQADAPAVAARLPAPTLRHVLAALAAATGRAADEVERGQLRARERERQRFVSMVAHELRTPLAGLGGYLDLLAGGVVSDRETEREFVERGRGIVERMAALVGDLLELSRIEAGSVRLEIEACSLAEICERALAPVAPLAAERGIRLVTDLPPRIRTARVDRRRAEQVVSNLVANACKFSPAGGRVELDARVEGPVAIVVVRDEGAGIERPDRERIFRPFARLDGHERVPGTGLGLAISRDLARAMGGDIALASVPASGSSFIVGLPAAAEVPRAAVTAALAVASDAEEVRLEERAILRALRDDAAGGRTARGAARGSVSPPTARPADGRPRRAEAPAIDAA
ncbi:MAG TPA: HAMP domain-containing sensor histidine kinase [Patescibacteria group bacterium]|nr:HAMP domain-containing sensor histidine kinase [Patescibacteria group bacterium]